MSTIKEVEEAIRLLIPVEDELKCWDDKYLDALRLVCKSAMFGTDEFGEIGNKCIYLEEQIKIHTKNAAYFEKGMKARQKVINEVFEWCMSQNRCEATKQLLRIIDGYIPVSLS